MTDGPHLADGETLLHHHVPDLGAFKRTALLMLGVTLVPTAVVLYLIPDTFWGAVPLFVTCVILMQERVTLGKHAAWVTDRQVIWQKDRSMALADIGTIDTIGQAVRLRPIVRGSSMKLYYPSDRASLRNIISSAVEGAK